jgi:hypothetical protein
MSEKNPEVRSKEIFDELRFEFKELFDAEIERVDSQEQKVEFPDDPFKNNRAILMKVDWIMTESILRVVSRFLAKKGL